MTCRVVAIIPAGLVLMSSQMEVVRVCFSFFFVEDCFWEIFRWLLVAVISAGSVEALSTVHRGLCCYAQYVTSFDVDYSVVCWCLGILGGTG